MSLLMINCCQQVVVNRPRWHFDAVQLVLKDMFKAGFVVLSTEAFSTGRIRLAPRQRCVYESASRQQAEVLTEQLCSTLCLVGLRFYCSQQFGIAANVA